MTVAFPPEPPVLKRASQVTCQVFSWEAPHIKPSALLPKFDTVPCHTLRSPLLTFSRLIGVHTGSWQRVAGARPMIAHLVTVGHVTTPAPCAGVPHCSRQQCVAPSLLLWRPQRCPSGRSSLISNRRVLAASGKNWNPRGSAGEELLDFMYAGKKLRKW